MSIDGSKKARQKTLFQSLFCEVTRAEADGVRFLGPYMVDRQKIIKDGQHLRELAIATLGAIAALRDAVPKEVSHAA